MIVLMRRLQHPDENDSGDKGPHATYRPNRVTPLATDHWLNAIDRRAPSRLELS